jgi:hypothetical protein
LDGSEDVDVAVDPNVKRAGARDADRAADTDLE